YATKEIIARKSSKQERTLKIVPSQLLDIILEETKKRPDITAKEAARYANTLLSQHGFNYEFDACPIVKADRRPRNVPGSNGLARAYRFPMTQADGRKIFFQFISDPMDELCGSCEFIIPAMRVTRREILLVSEGKQYLLKRPPGFIVKEMDL